MGRPKRVSRGEALELMERVEWGQKKRRNVPQILSPSQIKGGMPQSQPFTHYSGFCWWCGKTTTVFVKVGDEYYWVHKNCVAGRGWKFYMLRKDGVVEIG